MAEIAGERPLALVMDSVDSVAVATQDLPAGSTIEAGGQRLTLRQAIPFGHKLALHEIRAGELVLKYGQPIGRATAHIVAGEHVHVHNVESLRGRGDWAETQADQIAGEQGRRGAREPSPLHPSSPAPSLPGAPLTFPGYRRRDGRAGVRNHVLVLATVGCANRVVERLGQELPEVIALAQPWGCSQIGADLEQTRRVLEAFASHPNVGATLLVGLGCETMPTVEMAEKLAGQGTIVQRLTIQEEGGSRATLGRAVGIARELLQETARAQREPVPLSELILGVECGGSDGWSGITANPAVGAAADMLVAAGGTVILSEVPEFIGGEHLLAERAAAPEIGRAIVDACLRYEGEARRMGVDLRGAQPTPGNIAGGLTTIEEKSLGAITKGGTTTVQEFVGYGLRPSCRGLVVMDTPGNDPESVTGMVAGGAQVVAFTTGRGSPTGCPIAPVIKIATNSVMFRQLREDMDLDAGTVLEEGESLASAGQRIFAEMADVAAGKQTAAEVWGAREFAINMIGPRL